MAMNAMRPAAFFDKDGTLVENVPYNADPEKIRLAPGALEAARMLRRAGFALVVVSNQSGVARGYFPERALETVRRRISELLAGAGAQLDGFYYCPHLPDAAVLAYARACDCRKPAPGLIERAADDLGLDLERSWLIGDILDDVEAGRRAGCRTALIDNGNETEWRRTVMRTPDIVVPTLDAAARAIVAMLEPQRPPGRAA
jgi:histidinol-phosphate phosphatase family protein